MIEVNSREARIQLSQLLTEAEHGQTVSITRRGQVVAQLVPPPAKSTKPFPDLTQFRKSIKRAANAPSSARLIRQMRDEERY